jgi:hypothetical protein
MSSVTHGLMSRVFLMKWYHFSVEYFEDLRNVNHCEFLIMRKQPDSGKYILENNLRTWSQLKKDKEAALLKSPPKDKDDKKLERATTGTTDSGMSSPIPLRKRWGGCPNGCDHARHYHKKGLDNSMHAMASVTAAQNATESLAARRPAHRRWQSSSDEDEDDPRGRIGPPRVDVQKSLDEVVSSPDGTPSFISIDDRLRSRLKSPSEALVVRAGRDFGGSASGNTSQAGSDTEFSADDEMKKKLAYKERQFVPRQPVVLLHHTDDASMGRGAKADALGDQSDVGSDDEPDLDEEERLERSVKGSVY